MTDNTLNTNKRTLDAGLLQGKLARASRSLVNERDAYLDTKAIDEFESITMDLRQQLRIERENVERLEEKLDRKDQSLNELRLKLNEIQEANETLRGENYKLRLRVDEQNQILGRMESENIELEERVEQMVHVYRENEKNLQARIEEAILSLRKGYEEQIMELKNEANFRMYKRVRHLDTELEKLNTENTILRKQRGSVGTIAEERRPRTVATEVDDGGELILTLQGLLHAHSRNQLIQRVKELIAVDHQSEKIRVMISSLVGAPLTGATQNVSTITTSSPSKSVNAAGTSDVQQLLAQGIQYLSLKKCWRFMKNVLQEYLSLKRLNASPLQNKSATLSRGAVSHSLGERGRIASTHAHAHAPY